MNLKKIETEVAVDKIAHKGVSIWPILKSYLVGIVGENNIIKEANLPYLRLFLKTLPSDLLSIRNMGKSKYWVFSSSQTRFHINEDSFDRVSTGLLKYLKGYVLLENPIPKGKTESKKLQKGEYYVGMSWIYLIQFIILKLSKSPEIENLDLLETYLKKDLSKIKYIYHRIHAGKRLYNMLFKLYKPKAIFVVCYYSNFELILAAKKNNIPVIELQHGLVTDSHRAYHFEEKQPNNLMPDYFLSYGKYASDTVIKGNLFEKGWVLDYGYTFIEEVQERLSVSYELQEIKKSFKKTVCITGQLKTTDEPLLEIISSISLKFPEICFIFKPRHYVDRESFISSTNLVRLGEINTYELLKYCDYHLTVYSTCALEALALGTPTISLNIKGYYNRFLKRLLGENPYNFVAETEEQLVDVLNEIEGRTFVKSKIKESISHVFSPQVDTEGFNDFFSKIVN
ncbi:hypothetical protein [Zobellia uliginosa]|uniref:hypothetical protein n=1 Tax=Zobellia uliginosa TaxID=143224 RepID=UPI001C065705|nr:hypothetical protein [Zobellia uliginosa]MBU2948251.1 hypothetical protein [Zobellia uliginosa]